MIQTTTSGARRVGARAVVGRCFPILLLLSLVAGCRTEGDTAVTAVELMEHTTYLASDELAGRYVGTPGIEDAERYIAGFFEASGLEPLPGSEDYFLEFELARTAFDIEDTELSITRNDRTVTYAAGVDFRPFPFSATESVTGPVVFAGYGITAPEHGYDDYRGLDVTGKMVLVLRHEPNERDPQSRFEGTKHTKHAHFTTKAENAAAHGATAMLLVTDPLHHSASEDLRLRYRYAFPGDTSEPSVRRGDIPAIHVSRSVAETILGIDEARLEEVQRSIDAGVSPKELVAPDSAGTGSTAAGHRNNAPVRLHRGSVTAAVRVGPPTQFDPVVARNVAGALTGTGGEWLVIGAHHDHLGSYGGPGDTIFNGADDNASGVATVLELAEYFGETGAPEGFNLLFVTFSAEEVGLFGSKAFRRHRWIDLSDIGLMINLDMIGRNPSVPVEVYGAGTLEASARRIADLASRMPIDVTPVDSETPIMSDHMPFAERGVPYLAFHAGLHDDYHQVTDHAYRLDHAGMSVIGLFVARLIEELGAHTPADE